MAEVDLLTGASGSWANVQAGGAGHNPLVFGSHFAVSDYANCTGIAFYRWQTGSSGAASAVRLYNQATQELLWEDTSPTDSDSVGLQRTTIDPPIDLEPDTVYIAAVVWPDGNQATGYGISSGTPTEPLLRADPEGCSDPWPGTGFPDATQQNYWWANVYVEIDLDIEPPGSAPVTYGQLHVALNQWLGTTPTQPEANPGGWLDDVLDAIVASVGTGLNAAVDDLNDLATAIRTGQTDWGDVPAGLIGGLTQLTADFLQDWEANDAAYKARLLGSDAGGGSAFYGPEGIHVASGVEQLLASVGDGRLLTRPPAAGWSLIASETWDGEIAWAQPADVYVLNVTDTGGRPASMTVAGVPVYLRLGWWAALNGTQMGQRGYFDAALSELDRLPCRLPGIVLRALPGCSGTIEAWQWSP